VNSTYPFIIRNRRILDVEIAKVDNRMRKYYKLTEAGRGNRESLSELEDFIRNMQSLVNPKPSLEF
jgi:DNA-binding PadR family transcriptional regulator